MRSTPLLLYSISSLLGAGLVLSSCSLVKRSVRAEEEVSFVQELNQRKFEMLYGDACAEEPGAPASAYDEIVETPELAKNRLTLEEAYPEIDVGELKTTRIQAVLDRAHDALPVCWDGLAEAYPDLRGEIVVRFLIAPDGTVGASTVASNDTGVDPLACCLQLKIREVVFPAPQGEGIVVVDLNLPFGRQPTLE